ncbi:uncharacterized protein [Argopecten irradians]|uniref:uncharacterized protein n=1 Tax=Argopecten irradians TaxID=31199 RepID=UPI0037209722
MADMLVIVLVLCLCRELEGAVPQQRDQPQQWTEFETSLNQRLATMERQLTDKDVQIRNLETKLESHITVYSKYVTDNEREIQKKNIEINQLKERVRILTQKVNCVSSQDTYNDESVPTSDAVQINSDQTITGSESSERKSPRHRQTRVTQPSSVVAFHSELTQEPAVSKGNTVVFNHETLDEGQGYNPVDGIYIVPETGTYVFVWVMFAEFRQHIQTLLMVNGAVRGSSFSDAQEVHDLHQATSVVVLKVNQGDHVFIKVGHTSVTSVTFHYDRNYNGASTFSGWKLT